jgi:CheY-like chemotaxis protein
VALDGAEAVSKYLDTTFDMILMDVQMPKRDGFETTADIRAMERDSGRHTPIIAMTAHAMKGDRERCLAAGMDAYVPKPIRAENLFDAIETLAGHTRENGPADGPAPSRGERDPDPDVFDIQTALEGMGGDGNLLKEIAALFVDSLPENLAEIERAVAEGDAVGLERAAHSLKGAVSNFGAKRAYEAARSLESSGKENQMQGVEHDLAALERELEALADQLKRLASGYGR